MLGLRLPGRARTSTARRGRGRPGVDRLPARATSTTTARYDFSFSGLKTAVARWVEARERAGEPVPVADVAASFQEAVVDVLTKKAIAACQGQRRRDLLIGGGVAANSRLRALAEARCAAGGHRLRVPRPEAVHRQRRDGRRARRGARRRRAWRRRRWTCRPTRPCRSPRCSSERVVVRRVPVGGSRERAAGRRAGRGPVEEVFQGRASRRADRAARLLGQQVEDASAGPSRGCARNRRRPGRTRPGNGRPPTGRSAVRGRPHVGDVDRDRAVRGARTSRRCRSAGRTPTACCRAGSRGG